MESAKQLEVLRGRAARERSEQERERHRCDATVFHLFALVVAHNGTEPEFVEEEHRFTVRLWK